MRFLKHFSLRRLGQEVVPWSAVLIATTAMGVAVPIEVKGWPLPDLSTEAPPVELGDDPVIGRQICPPLTRLNLSQRRSEDLLLRRISETSSSGQMTWTLEVRSGLFWWGGDQVTSEDLVKYLETALPQLVQERGAGLWLTPPFRVRSDSPFRITVTWETKPVFGPYILSGAPFYKSATSGSTGLRYECVGLYQPKRTGDHLVLIPTKAYKSAHEMPEIRLYEAGGLAGTGTTRSVEFRSAYEIPAESLGNDPQNSCRVSVDLSVATMILWNTQAGLMKDRKLRQILTQLTPRGALVRSGTSSLAEISSNLVPKDHPGYNTRLPLRNFDMRAAFDSLDTLGFKRRVPGGLRYGADGQILELLILTQQSTVGLAEKVMSDAFTAAGVGVRFASAPTMERSPDGILSSFSLDWPRSNLLGNFHSGVRNTAPFWTLGDKNLDTALEDYAASLTSATPDFSKLIKVQELLYDLEPATVIFQHKACMIAGPGLRPFGKAVSLKDPDWFRQLLF